MIKRGEIYLVDLNSTKGGEQAGRRSVLVVSSDAINRQPLVITVVVGTDARTVLPQDTVFLCFQVLSLDAARFHLTTGPVGRMPASRMADVERAIRMVLEL